MRDGCVRIMDLLADETAAAGGRRGAARGSSGRSPRSSRTAAPPEIYDTDHEIFSPPLDALRYLPVENLPQPAAEWHLPVYSGQPIARIW